MHVLDGVDYISTLLPTITPACTATQKARLQESCNGQHTLHLFNGVKHILNHAFHRSLAHHFVLPQLKGAAQQWNDDELHGVCQLVPSLLLAGSLHQSSIVCLEAGQEMHQNLQHNAAILYMQYMCIGYLFSTLTGKSLHILTAGGSEQGRDLALAACTTDLLATTEVVHDHQGPHCQVKTVHDSMEEMVAERQSHRQLLLQIVSVTI